MLSITDGGSLTRVLSLNIEEQIKQLLRTRCLQLGGDPAGVAHFVIVQPGDEAAAVERELSFSVFQNPVLGTSFGQPDFTPAWEWIADHGFAFELVFILDDSGFAHVVIVEKSQGVRAELLRLCALYASADV